MKFLASENEWEASGRNQTVISFLSTCCHTDLYVIFVTVPYTRRVSFWKTGARELQCLHVFNDDSTQFWGHAWAEIAYWELFLSWNILRIVEVTDNREKQKGKSQTTPAVLIDLLFTKNLLRNQMGIGCG